MTAPLQRIANRANASQSTGPATTGGKQTSRTKPPRADPTLRTRAQRPPHGPAMRRFPLAVQPMAALSPSRTSGLCPMNGSFTPNSRR